MSLHAKIMALPIEMDGVNGDYLDGHYDARHDASKIAAQHDAVMERLVAALAMARLYVIDRGSENEVKQCDAALAAHAEVTK